MSVATQTKPSKSRVTHGIGFYMTIDEKAEGSLDLVKCLNQEKKVIYFERTGEGFYFIVGVEAKIREICEDFPGCLMKLEPVQ